MCKIVSFLQKSFGSLKKNLKIPLEKMAHFLTKCAKSHSYVETLGDHADSLHSWIKQSYEEDFKRSFELVVRESLKHLRGSIGRLAIDFTSDPFYGKTTSPFLFGVDRKDKKKWKYEFKYLTVCLITRNKEIPLMAIPIYIGLGVAKPTIELLEYCKSLFKFIRFVVFDRGFYCAELIDYLEANKFRYLMLVPEKDGTIKEYINQTTELGRFDHQMKYSKKKSTWLPKTTIVICKRIDEWSWVFATNIHFKTRSEYIWYYKRRWQIETNNRVEDEAKIKSKSNRYIIRYFYFLISLLLHVLWRTHIKINNYVPFKKYIDIVEQKLFMNYQVLTPI